jgi:hypothetical protein
VVVKDMEGKTQTTVPGKELVNKIKAMVSAGPR